MSTHAMEARRGWAPSFVVSGEELGGWQQATIKNWVRGPDSNRQPPGYEPDELPVAPPRTLAGIIAESGLPCNPGGCRWHVPSFERETS